MKCSSCGSELASVKIRAEFACPSCGESKIGRCERCKKLSREYACTKCGFLGP